MLFTALKCGQMSKGVHFRTNDGAEMAPLLFSVDYYKGGTKHGRIA